MNEWMNHWDIDSICLTKYRLNGHLPYGNFNILYPINVYEKDFTIHYTSTVAAVEIENHTNNDSTTKTQTLHTAKLPNVKNRMRSTSSLVCLIRKQI